MAVEQGTPAGRGRPPANSGLVTCPRCRFAQAFGNHDCVGCGASLESVPEDPVAAKQGAAKQVAAKQVAAKQVRPSPSRPAAREAVADAAASATWVRRVEPAAWKALAAGFAVAAACSFVPLLELITFPITRTLQILAHEFGHALTFWLFGHPSFPKVDSILGMSSGNYATAGPRFTLIGVVYLPVEKVLRTFFHG